VKRASPKGIKNLKNADVEEKVYCGYLVGLLQQYRRAQQDWLKNYPPLVQRHAQLAEEKILNVLQTLGYL
jgi:hypothetical protein